MRVAWAAAAALAASEPSSPDNAWLEASLADIAQRMQSTLAEINPDKATAHLNRRLDAIEERFNEALSKVAQRSDLDGLRLIEAHVLELAAHLEHTRGRLDRIDAIDDQVRVSCAGSKMATISASMPWKAAAGLRRGVAPGR